VCSWGGGEEVLCFWYVFEFVLVVVCEFEVGVDY